MNDLFIVCFLRKKIQLLNMWKAALVDLFIIFVRSILGIYLGFLGFIAILESLNY